MECKRCQPWLADKALGALDSRRDAELAAHLATCPGCRAALDREQLLFAAIHRGVAKSVAASPSSEMTTRIRQRVITAAVAEHAWLFGSRHWIPLAAAAALMLAFGSLWLIHRRTVERGEVTKSVAAKPAPAIGNPLRAVAKAGGKGVGPKPRASRVNRDMTSQIEDRSGQRRVGRNSPVEPEVLVDKGEAKLVLQLYYSANRLPADHSRSVHLTPEPERDADGNLAALEIPPLESGDLEPKSGSEETGGKTPAEDRPDDVQR
jgi:hypothetical protein